MQKSFDEGVAAQQGRQARRGDREVHRDAGARARLRRTATTTSATATSQKKDYAAAEAAFKKAIELKPDYVDAWNGLANVYNAEGKTDLAIEASGKAAQSSGAARGGGGGGGGGSASALYNQGVILWNAGKFPEAKEKFEAATKADPNNADAQYRLGMANVNLGDMPGAVSAFEAYLKAAPTGPHADEVKAFIAAMKKSHESAWAVERPHGNCLAIWPRCARASSRRRVPPAGTRPPSASWPSPRPSRRKPC